jgi:hypothetical protein
VWKQSDNKVRFLVVGNGWSWRTAPLLREQLDLHQLAFVRSLASACDPSNDSGLVPPLKRLEILNEMLHLIDGVLVCGLILLLGVEELIPPDWHVTESIWEQS